MASEFSVGTRVIITHGDYKGKKGTVVLKDKHPIVVCDDKTELMAVTTANARRI